MELPEFIKWIYEHPWGTAAIVVGALGLVVFVWFAIFTVFKKAIIAALKWVGHCIALVLAPGLQVFALKSVKACCNGGCIKCGSVLVAQVLAGFGTVALIPVSMIHISDPERMFGTSVPGWPFGLWLAEIAVSVGVCWLIYVKRRERARLDAYARENAELDLELAEMRGSDEPPTEALIASERAGLLHDIASTESETMSCDGFVALILRWQALKAMSGEGEDLVLKAINRLFRNVHLDCTSRRKQSESQFMEQLRKAFQKPPE